jgi:hypothetical protein
MRVEVYHEGTLLGSVDAPHVPRAVGLAGRDGIVAFDLVRVTELPEESADAR